MQAAVAHAVKAVHGEDIAGDVPLVQAGLDSLGKLSRSCGVDLWCGWPDWIDRCITVKLWRKWAGEYQSSCVWTPCSDQDICCGGLLYEGLRSQASQWHEDAQSCSIPASQAEPEELQ